MCESCGCSLGGAGGQPRSPLSPLPALSAPVAPGAAAQAVLHGLLEDNDRQARRNRARLDAQAVLTVNLMSAPGSGKTSLLESTLRRLGGQLRAAVVEGDLETDNDARRIRALGVPAHQVTTGTACHLDAALMAGALEALDPAGLDLLFVENVGNLVCPASFDLGHHLNVVLLSVTEGDDKPAKYPVMFRAADLVLLTKADLAPHLPEFSPHRARQALRDLASEAPVLSFSARTGEGLEDWLAWLQGRRTAYLEGLRAGRTLLPRVQAARAHQGPPAPRPLALR